jgi:predicted PurR-regulated permease PerM
MKENTSRLEIAEKLIVPLLAAFFSLVTAILAAILVFTTDRQANKIAEQQNQIQQDIASLQSLQFGQELEQKYIEIFYDEITSRDASRQTVAISLLREINPQTGEKLNLWAQRSGISRWTQLNSACSWSLRD